MKIGDAIPGLGFDSYQDGKIAKRNLAEFRGKWLVLAFYPADFTFVCPTELEEFADLHEEFRKEGAEIVSMSTDTAYSHKAWHDSSPSVGKIRYAMGADPAHAVCKEFGTHMDSEGLSLRATFIIDPDGKVKWFEVHDNSIGRNAKEILRKLRAASFVRQHVGEVCPAGWEPGKKAMKPSFELIGKI